MKLGIMDTLIFYMSQNDICTKMLNLAYDTFLTKKPYKVKISKLSYIYFILYKLFGQNSLFDDKLGQLGAMPSFSIYLIMAYTPKCLNLAYSPFLTKNLTR